MSRKIKKLIEKYSLNAEQLDAVKLVEKNIKKDKKLGVTFQGQQWDLCAYNSKVFEDKVNTVLYEKASDIEVPHYTMNVLGDSSANDVEYFKKEEK